MCLSFRKGQHWRELPDLLHPLMRGVYRLIVALAVLALVGLTGVRIEATEPGDATELVRTQLRGVEAVLKFYRLDVGEWPSSQQGLKSLLTPPEDSDHAGRWKGPYAENVSVDSWGNPLLYRWSPRLQEENSPPVVWSIGADQKPDTEDDIGNWQARNEASSSPRKSPATWKDLGLDKVPEDYPVDGISLVDGLNQLRGSWMFHGTRIDDEKEERFVARLVINGRFKSAFAQEKFPGWQFGIEWIEDGEKQQSGFLMIGMPEPNGFGVMLVRPPMQQPVAGQRLNPMLFKGDWNADRRTITWTLFNRIASRLPAVSEREDKAGKPLESFEMVLYEGGGFALQNYRNAGSGKALRFVGRTQERIGKPFVEKELKITELPNGYRMFFASSREVCLMNADGDIVAGARVSQLGTDDDLIYGIVSKFNDSRTAESTPGHFWTNTKTGEIRRGLERKTWREKLRELGIEDPQLAAPDKFGPRY